MGINGLQGNVNETKVVVPAQATAKATASNNTSQQQSTPTDILEISGQNAKSEGTGNNTQNAQKTQNKPTYSADISRMREIWTEHDRQVQSFQRLVEKLLQRQVEESEKAGIEWDFNDPDAMVTIDDETRAEAQEAIGERGYFSSEETAKRLLDFAVAISGGDPSRLGVLRDAVERGFANAESKWGGELPEISQKTKELVMNGFDEWEKNGSADDISLLSDTTGDK